MGGADGNLPIVEAAARWVTRIIGILGLDRNANPPYEGIGWSSAGVTTGVNGDPKTAVGPYASVFSTVVAEIEALHLSDVPLQNLLEQQSPEVDFEALEKRGEQDIEKLALPYIRAVSRQRDELRRIVSSETALDKSSKAAILGLTDRIRDYDLADLGVQLDDQLDRPSLIKFAPAAKLIAAREEKAAAIAEKALQKERGMSCVFRECPALVLSMKDCFGDAFPVYSCPYSPNIQVIANLSLRIARKEREVAGEEKWEKAKLAPQDMFKGDEKYREWDVEGIPSKLADGSELPKNQLKKLKKEWEKQKKLHEEYLAKFGTDA